MAATDRATDSPLPPLAGTRQRRHSLCSMTEEQYCGSRQQDAGNTSIDGDIFQAVLSRRFDQPRIRTACLTAYRVLRTTNPSPVHGVSVHRTETEIMCSSPETLVTSAGRAC